MGRILRDAARHQPPAPDPNAGGLDLLDVLFALVVVEILRPLADYQDLSVAAWSHLALAAVLTLTGWIGYRRRAHPRFALRFFGLPLWAFAIDLLVVVACWLTAVTAELPGTVRDGAVSVRTETIFVISAFALYSLRDAVGRRLRPGPTPGVTVDERERRTVVTEVAAASAFLLGIAALLTQGWVEPLDPWHAVVFDGLFVALLIGYRAATDYAPPSPAVSRAGEDASVTPTRSSPAASR